MPEPVFYFILNIYASLKSEQNRLRKAFHKIISSVSLTSKISDWKLSKSFPFYLEELKATSFCQLITPSSQKSLANCRVNLFIILA